MSWSGSGCSDASDPGDGITFEPFPGWPDGVAVRKVGDASRTSITKLEVGPGDLSWLLRDDIDSDPADARPVVERYRRDGALDQRLRFPAGTRIPEMVVHPGGQLSLFVLAPDAATSPPSCTFERCPLAIVRVSPDGAMAAPVPLVDPQGEVRMSTLSHVVAIADGEGLDVVAWSFGIKLYRLDDSYRVRWSAEIMPPHIGQAYSPAQESLARDARGNIYVGYQIFEDDVAIYNEHFQRAPLRPIGWYDVLVEAFDPEGGFLGARLFGGPGADEPASMAVHDGRVIIAGSSRLTKHDPAVSPNRSMEWDLLVATGQLTDTADDTFLTIDRSRDDHASHAIIEPDGRILVVGRTDYVQVDTNSEVENGRGLFLELTPDLQLGRELTLTGPRDVQIADCQSLTDGSLIFAGIRNGPLTHTDPSERNNDGILGVASF